MKYLIFKVFFTFFLIIITSCKKDKLSSPVVYERYDNFIKFPIGYNKFGSLFTGIKELPDGRSATWVSDASASLDSTTGKISLIMLTYEDTLSFLKKEYLGLRNLDTILNLIQIPVKSTMNSQFKVNSSFFTLDHDAIDGVYQLDETANNSIRITKFDSINKIIEGECEAHFVLERESDILKLAPKFSINKGKFRVRMQ
jgi:hypothetical protein